MVCVFLFARLRTEQAVIASLLGAYFLLPSNLDVQVAGLPPLDKGSVSAIATFVLCWTMGRANGGRRGSIFIYLLCAGFVLSPVLTSFSNSYELQNPAGSIPGFYPIDGVKYIGRQLIALLPLFIGLRFLSSDYGRKVLLKSLPLVILLYSPLMLFELRMSPQLHRWVYGYFPSSFAQNIRSDGFRPVVFLSHGLELALIVSLALIAVVVLAKQKIRIFQVPTRVLSAYFTGLLILCKSLGPMIFAIFLVPVIWFTRPKTWVKIACAILIFVAVYPALRTYKLVPLDTIDRVAASISTERNASFKQRVMNEEQLLERANEKPMVGWGAWGRNRLYDQWTGQSISVTDGGWIITFGVWGWVGYLSTFLVFAVGAFRAHRSIGRQVDANSITLGGLALLLAVFVLNMLPNTSNMTIPLLITGSIAASGGAMVRRKARPSAAVRPDVSPAVAPDLPTAVTSTG